MNKIETAKALLKKGIALGDQELIDMANSMLEVNTLWYCEKCEDTFDNSKNRKSCPKCKSRKISVTEPVQMQSSVEEIDPYDESQYAINKEEPDYSEEDKNYGRTSNFEKGRFQPNKLNNELDSISDEELASELGVSVQVLKKPPARVTHSKRKPVKQYKYVCSFCHRDIKSYVPLAGTFHICNRCGNR